MRAVEFKTKLVGNQIQVPQKIESELNQNKEQEVRVILLFDDEEAKTESAVQAAIQAAFLKGYADSDTIYDEE